MPDLLLLVKPIDEHLFVELVYVPVLCDSNAPICKEYCQLKARLCYYAGSLSQFYCASSKLSRREDERYKR